MPENIPFEAKLAGVYKAYVGLYETYGADVSWAKHPLSKLTPKFMDRVLATDHSSPLIYDLGCGDGSKTLQLAMMGAAHGLRVVGFDYVPAAIESARRMAIQLGLQDRVSFEHANILELPERLERAAGVHEYQAFCHIPKEAQGQFAGIVNRLLLPDGIFLTNTFSKDTTNFYGVNISDLPNGEYIFRYDPNNPQHQGRETMDELYCYFFTRRQMRQIWSKGFIIEKLNKEPHPSIEGRYHFEGLMARK